MKLVVDIDEKDYRRIQDRVISDESWGLNLSDIDVAISEGKSLDAVLGEIQEEINAEMEKDYGYTQGIRTGYLSTLSIIDKYRESEKM